MKDVCDESGMYAPASVQPSEVTFGETADPEMWEKAMAPAKGCLLGLIFVLVLLGLGALGVLIIF